MSWTTAKAYDGLEVAKKVLMLATTSKAYAVKTLAKGLVKLWYVEQVVVDIRGLKTLVKKLMSATTWKA